MYAIRMLALWTCCWTVLLVDPVQAQLSNSTSPTSQWITRPDIYSPIIDFAILRPELIQPGYIFLAPYRNLAPGPYIYDSWGELVWAGGAQAGPKTAHAPQVCQYHDEPHLCYFEGEQHQGFARGHGVILNKHYQVVKILESAAAGASADMHEFTITPYSNGTTVLMTIYQPRPYDLTVNPRFNVQSGMGWIVESVFQEVEIDTGRLVFEWRSLDHVDPGQSWTMPGTTDTSGDGLHEQTPWDYFHINSIDKNGWGDFLVSARHVSAIYKISGKDGHVMWQIGGNTPTIRNDNFAFSYQHHARWVSENETHTVFSFFDNAHNGVNRSNEFSYGRVVVIDHTTNTSRLVEEYGAPESEGGLTASSQGSMQLLPGGGCHIGWGEFPYFSEHAADGSTVMYGRLAVRASNVMIYRSYKFNWTGMPLTTPDLWTYSRTGERMVFYVSWNGATEVRNWNFYTSRTANGPWSLTGSTKKRGFETEHHIPFAADWAYAEAVDQSGRVLKQSGVVRTFRAPSKVLDVCDDRKCAYAQQVPREYHYFYEWEAKVPDGLLSTHREYNTSHYYLDMTANAARENGSAEDSEGQELAEWEPAQLIIFGAILGTLASIGLTSIALHVYTQRYAWMPSGCGGSQGEHSRLLNDSTGVTTDAANASASEVTIQSSQQLDSRATGAGGRKCREFEHVICSASLRSG